MPLVSVIIPMYNAEPYISATLTSILEERDIPLEVVVVHDCCTDASLDKVRAIADQRVRVVDGPCRGAADAMNAGLAAACGEIIMRCDADDLYTPQRIARQATWLSEHPEFGAVCGNYSTIDPKGRLITNFRCGEETTEITEELRSGIARTHFGTYAVRSEVLRTVGGNRQFFKTAEDIDLQLRIGESCRVCYVPEIQYRYRLHAASLTHKQSNIEREFFESLAREFQRQRQIQGSDDLQRGCPPNPPKGDAKAMESVEHIQGLLIGTAWDEHHAGRKQRALALGIRSVISQPSSIGAWRSLLALAVKPVGKEQKGE